MIVGTITSNNSTGSFTGIHDSTGYSLEGQLKFKSNNSYLISGTATGCINALHNGAISGYGAMHLQGVPGLTPSIFILNINHVNTSFIESKYQRLTLTSM